MPVRKFCKIIGVLILTFFWFPVLWLSLGASLVAMDVEKEISKSKAKIERSIEELQNSFGDLGVNSPKPDFSPILERDMYPSTNYFLVSQILYLILLPLFSVWLFFPRNPLELLFVWLAENRNEVSLTTIIISSEGMGPVVPVEAPTISDDSDGQEKEDNSKYRHPHEKYLPPQYRNE